MGKDGTDGRLGQDEIQDAEGYFEALFNALRGFLICLNVAGFPDVGDQEIAIFTDLFAADIKSFREKQNRRKLEEERRRQRAEELKRMRS